MRKMLVVTILTLAGLLGGESKASAFCWGGWWTCGYPAFCGYPYGWGGLSSSGCYYYAPYYPWFAYYNYSMSPYAWPNGYVAGNYPAYLPPAIGKHPPAFSDYFAATKDSKPATVVATLPADAELLFNGVAANNASGAERSFQTAPLTPGKAYEYTLTARVMRDGKPQIVTEKVVVKAGEQTRVSLMPRNDVTSVAGK